MRIFSCFALSFSLVGCFEKHSATYEQGSASGTAAESATLYQEGLTLWQGRDDAQKLKAALDKFEAAYTADPTNREAATLLTRGWYFWGDVKTDVEEEKLAAWDTAVQWGGRCMAVNTEFTDLLQKGDETERTAIRVMSIDDAGCLYWAASALGKWAKLKGFSTLIKHKDTVKGYIAKVEELDENYFYAGPDRYFGVVYAVAPGFAGGDIDKALLKMDESISIEPNYLGTKVLKAKYYATKKQDAALFIKLLDEVLAADPEAIPEIAPENRAEQLKAKNLKAKRSDLFVN
jgi:tetratricopeptide (TPR) repeat protein